MVKVLYVWSVGNVWRLADVRLPGWVIISVRPWFEVAE